MSVAGDDDDDESTRVTDGQTDRQTELRLPRPLSHMLAR